MDKKSKIFFIVFGLLITGSVAVTYWRIMIKKDYIIEAQANCDPATEKCFMKECDPASDVEEEKCTGDAAKDTSYYKIIKRNASRIPLCDPTDENCTALVCGENEPECEYTFCTEENKEAQGVECSVSEEPAVEDSNTEATNTEATNTEATSTEEGATCAPDSDTCAVSLPKTVEATTSEEVATTTETVN